jgi:branched-chain amino acid transport system ATP-binding protein
MLLKVNEITAGYSALMILQDLSISMEAGELITVLGPNGAGKSTLINTIAGLVPLNRGTIEFNGQRIDGLPPYLISRKGISICGQMRYLFGDMNVKDNLMLAAHNRVQDPQKKMELLQKVFELFPVLKERISQRSRTLSGGEQQMLGIARTLMSNPDLIILDEPTLGLSPMLCEEIFHAIEEMHQMGRSVLLVEQNAELSLAVASRAYIFEGGRKVLEGQAKELIENPKVKESYLGQ